MKESRMQRLRKHYGVPAKRGGRILFTHTGKEGRITSADDGQRLRVLFDGETRPSIIHPTWKVAYI
jgi:hypothetical protein